MPHFDQTQHDETLHLSLQGCWVLAESVAIHNALNVIKPATNKVLVLDASRVESVDVSGAWLVYQQAQRWQQQGISVQFEQFPAEYLAYFTATSSASSEAGKSGGVVSMIQGLGKRVFGLGNTLHSAIAFLGHSVIALFQSLFAPREFRLRSVLHHVFATGITATPIVGLIACLISIVITYQGGGAVARIRGGNLYRGYGGDFGVA
ncbi:MAG: hypothetical protein BWK73_33820 [Thiothrix lacustris]|uniref:MlaB-like STAS domain-containing protein n=1 Tax=Thiothrix lacustris TaxID=525917 RepID=A0A1Y1QGY7_9GAMM|nr:MAG: hypothetical protein BWK73_33820 [Thiothrix lacustris]